MIPVGSKVTLNKWPFEGILIGYCGEYPVIKFPRTTVFVSDIADYTDEDGNVRKTEEPIT
jgi:hypothetical protein